MGLCGSRAAGPSDDDAKSVTSVVPSQDSGGGLTEARLKEMYRQDSDYMEATGYGAVAMFCGGDAAKRLDDDCHSSDDDDDDGDVDDYYGHGRYGEYSSDGYSDAGSALSRQSSTDTLLSSRPGSAESFSSMSSVGSALDDGGGAPAMARVTAPGVATLGRNKGSSVKTFVSERQNSFEDRENERRWPRQKTTCTYDDAEKEGCCTGSGTRARAREREEPPASTRFSAGPRTLRRLEMPFRIPSGLAPTHCRCQQSHCIHDDIHTYLFIHCALTLLSSSFSECTPFTHTHTHTPPGSTPRPRIRRALPTLLWWWCNRFLCVPVCFVLVLFN